MTVGAEYKLPSDPAILLLLVTARQASPDQVIVHDVLGFDKTFPELLADMLKTRDALREGLPPAALDERGLLRRESPYVAILSRSAYEFLVAFFAIRALGGVAMPLGK